MNLGLNSIQFYFFCNDVGHHYNPSIEINKINNLRFILLFKLAWCTIIMRSITICVYIIILFACHILESWAIN